MARPAILADILAKLVRVNRALGTSNATNLVADIAVISALVVAADVVADAAQDEADAAESGNLSTQIAAIQTQLDATPK